MIKIWKDRILRTNAISHDNKNDNGHIHLFNSLAIKGLKADKDFTDFETGFKFFEYGIYVDRGTGREISKGNPGDIGRIKKRIAKPWENKAFYSSFRNILEFMAESLGEQTAVAIAKIISDKTGQEIK